MAEVVLTALAHVHVQRIYARFEEYQEGLGDRFSDEFEKCLALLASNPRLFAADEVGVRRLPFWKDRYGIFWVDEARGVVVVSVLPLGGDPRALRREIRRALNLD